MNFNVNWVFPHPEGPLTMELNGCLQDGSILQNEEDTGLNVILILSFMQSPKCSYLYTISRMFVFIGLYRTSFVFIGLYRMSFVSQQNVNKISIQQKNIYNSSESSVFSAIL